MALSLLKSTVNLPSGGSVTPNMLLSGMFEVNYGGATTINPVFGALDGNIFAVKLNPAQIDPITGVAPVISFSSTYYSALGLIDTVLQIPAGNASFYDPSGGGIKAWCGFFIQDQGISSLFSVCMVNI